MSDDELIMEIQQHNSKAALDTLIRRYYHEIYSFIYRRLQSQELAYDLTQEVFVKMIKSIKLYEYRNQFRKWLITIALNQVRDYTRSKIAQNRKQEEQIEEGRIIDEKKNIIQIYEIKEQSQEIQNALRILPEQQSEAIILKYYHGYKYGEIAQITQTNENTVKSRVTQGLKKLAGMVRRESEDDIV
ncbi:MULTISPECIES: RNA polymerase sigma factor [unclassified Lysinibacillus]|uniref:RNA polymerase sigma factor n=1 Tax=unclassified Lysinibacillus TaxID=2636778 RepID=UPI002010E225|nr:MULTISPECIES: RNA polymerase sigma factor [unclassified Lysinibacillus]MCL1697072.1 RNA polymerase sigma factor [Lysinibacillus sp. BPa_S21]MCL1701999.1 RNA polymerase sigma factor [Lysinibacillus sp. Bpr_S20]